MTKIEVRSLKSLNRNIRVLLVLRQVKAIVLWWRMNRIIFRRWVLYWILRHMICLRTVLQMQFEGQFKKSSTNKISFTPDEKPKVAPCHNTHFLYRLLKIHRPDMHLSPVVSSIDICCHTLFGFFHNIFSPFVGNKNFSVKIQTAP